MRGCIVIRTRFDPLTTFGDFSEGMAALRTVDGKWGYINRAGKVVIRPRFSAASEFALPDRR